LEEIAEEADLHRNYVGILERAKQSPSLDAICRLARALKVKPADLLSRFQRRTRPLLIDGVPLTAFKLSPLTGLHPAAIEHHVKKRRGFAVRPITRSPDHPITRFLLAL